MEGNEIMMDSLSFAFALASGLIFGIFAFVEYLVHSENQECEHENKTTYDSYHKQVCIDCGAEFSTTEIKK